MSILVNQDTKVICQGFTGKQGRAGTGELLRDAIRALLEVQPNLPWFGARNSVARPVNIRPGERLARDGKAGAYEVPGAAPRMANGSLI